jgi:hypothetical protein
MKLRRNACSLSLRVGWGELRKTSSIAPAARETDPGESTLMKKKPACPLDHGTASSSYARLKYRRLRGGSMR